MGSGGPGPGEAAVGDGPLTGFPAWRAAVDRRATEVAGPARRWASNRILLAGVGSTNALARRVTDEYLAEGVSLPVASFIAWQQTAGRGRHGRPWVSPPGAGAWVTLLHPLETVEQLSLLPLLVPLGLCEALDAHLPAERPCGIKWPNDLVVGGRKIGGVLIDGVAPGEGDPPSGAALVGFGVNLLQAEDEVAGLAAGGALAATSLAIESGRGVAVAAVLWDLVEAVAERISAAVERAAAVADYGRRSIHRPDERLRCRSGDETLEGRFRGFDERGFLLLELTTPGAGRESGEMIPLPAGEVIG